MNDQPLFEPVKPKLKTVSLEQIDPWQTAAHNSVKKSVAALGMTSTPLLQQTAVKRYRVVAGRRRLDAAKDAGFTEVPALVVPASVSDAEIHALGLASNLARSHSPIDEATDIQGLIDQGYDVDAVAKLLGISRATVDSRMRLLTLPASALDAVRDGRMTASVATSLSKLTPEQREHALSTLASEGKLVAQDVQEIRQAAKQQVAQELPDNLFTTGVTPGIKERFTNTARALMREGLTKHDLLALLEEATQEEPSHA